MDIKDVKIENKGRILYLHNIYFYRENINNPVVPNISLYFSFFSYRKPPYTSIYEVSKDLYDMGFYHSYYNWSQLFGDRLLYVTGSTLYLVSTDGRSIQYVSIYSQDGDVIKDTVI